MKQVLVFMFTILITWNLVSQEIGDLIPLSEVAESKALVAQAEEYAKAVMEDDFRKIAQMTHFDILTNGGGIEHVAADMERYAQEWAILGIQYDSVEIGEHPEFWNSEGELQTVVPLRFKMKMGDQIVESRVKLFAVSSDEGGTWHFVNLEKYDAESLHNLVDNVSEQLNFSK